MPELLPVESTQRQLRLHSPHVIVSTVTRKTVAFFSRCAESFEHSLRYRVDDIEYIARLDCTTCGKGDQAESASTCSWSATPHSSLLLITGSAYCRVVFKRWDHCNSEIALRANCTGFGRASTGIRLRLHITSFPLTSCTFYTSASARGDRTVTFCF